MIEFCIAIFCIGLMWISSRICSRFSPAQMFTWIWCALIFFVTVVLYNRVKLGYEGLIFILFGCAFMMCGEIVGKLVLKKTTKNTKLLIKRPNTKQMKLFIIAFLSLAIMYPFYMIAINGFDVTSLWSFETLLELNNDMTEERYSGGSQTTVANQILLVFCYIAPLYGGYCYRLIEGKFKVFCLATILPAAIVALTQAVKLGLITSAFMFIIGILLSSESNRLSLKISKTTLLKLGMSSALFIGILVLSIAFRFSDVGVDLLPILSEKFINYAIGSVPCFDNWYTDNTVSFSDLHGGTRTFMGISNILGLEHRVQGLYSEFLFWGKNGIDSSSNVYSSFRALVDDFGTIGSMLYLFLLGFFSCLCKIVISSHRKAWLAEVILGCIYAYVMWSFATSFFTYLSYIASFILLLFILPQTYSIKNIKSANKRYVTYSTPAV